MLVQSDKASMTIDRLAIENYFLNKNLKLNIKEINKRIKKVKELKEIYELEELLLKQRKVFAFEINYNQNDRVAVHEEVLRFLRRTFQEEYANKIKSLKYIGNFIYIKLKYNQVFENKEYDCGLFAIRQINPGKIIKKTKNLI